MFSVGKLSNYDKLLFSKIFLYCFYQHFKTSKLIRLENLQRHHTRTKKISLKKFTDSPRIKLAETEHLSLKELEKKMEEKYPCYAKRALVSNV